MTAFSKDREEGGSGKRPGNLKGIGRVGRFVLCSFVTHIRYNTWYLLRKCPPEIWLGHLCEILSDIFSSQLASVSLFISNHCIVDCAHVMDRLHLQRRCWMTCLRGLYARSALCLLGFPVKYCTVRRKGTRLTSLSRS